MRRVFHQATHLLIGQARCLDLEAPFGKWADILNQRHAASVFASLRLHAPR